MVNWGNVMYPGSNTQSTPTPTATLQNFGPFYHIDGFRRTPGEVAFRNITDGTSNTLMLSESLKAWVASDNDWRGDIHNDDGHFRFQTMVTPNTTAADLIASTTFFTPNNDRLMPIALGNPQRAAARSRHPGGVNASMCDGSVRFVAQSINLSTWMVMGTMGAGEVVQSN
jgi:prepilin-type processing-associated H-X9-DG protein